ncbi:MAG TPA: tetratricopeptide repeat protein [Anaerolineae bacterium]|nr:tetratricopeptide repeat protein [Anaerolineae bacterium]
MAKSETQRELDELLAQLQQPGMIAAKTAVSQKRLADSLLNLVVDLMADQEWDRARQTADIAEQIARNLTDRQLLAEVIFRRGIWHYRRGELHAALAAWQTAQEHFEAVKQDEGVANCRCNIGILYKDLGRTGEARHYLEEALAAYEQLDHKEGQAACLTNLGLVLRVQGDLQMAVTRYQTALQLYRELTDKEGEAAVLGNLGLVYLGLGRFQESLTHQEQALTINREIGYHKGEASALGNLGSAYAEMGDYANAERCYLEALAIDRELDNPLEVATDLLNLAQLYLEMGELARALAYANEARSLHQAGEREQGVLEATAVIALIYRLLGATPQAIAHMQQALALAQKLGHRHQEATIWNNFSMLHKDRGTWKEAAACQTKALELYQAVGDRDGQAVSLLNMGMIANRLGQPEEGLQLLQLAYQINRETGSREGQLLCQAQTAVILREQDKPEEALILQNEALAAAVHLNNPDHIWRIYLGRGGTYTKTERFAEAEADLRQAIHTIESLRGSLGHRRLKETFFGADKVSVYRRLVLLLVHQRQKAADALVTVERARLRLMLDELATTPIQLAKQDAEALLEQERRLLDQFQSIQRQVEAGQLTRKLEDERHRYGEALEQIWTQMAARSPMYVSLRRGDLFEYSEFRTILTGP